MSQPLHTPYVFWYFEKPPRDTPPTAYTDLQKRLAEVDTVSSFWQCWSHIRRPDLAAPPGTGLPQGCDLSVFRAGVRPVWEDAANARGGKLMVRLRKTGFAKHVFEDIVLAMVGNQLGDCGEQVCGVVYSARPFHEVVSVWTSDASDREAIAKIRQAVVARTGVPARLHMEYKVHDDSIRKAIGDKGFSSDKLDAE